MRHFILLLFFTFVLPLHGQQDDFKTIDFWRADYIADRHQGEDLYNMPKLVYGLTSQFTTDVERFRAIYFWVCHNIRADYNMMHKNNSMRDNFKDDALALEQWNNLFKKEVFNKLLHEKRTLCTGYAFMIKELSSLAGLECEIITGYGPTNKLKFSDLEAPNHSWNAVKLNGKWYLCDATWSSGIIDMSTFMFEFKFDDTYFLTEPSTFAKNHKPVDKKWALHSQLPVRINN